MTIVNIPLPVSSAKDSPARGGKGRLVNVLMEQLPDGTVNYKRHPGIAPFSSSAAGSVHCRGFQLVNDSELIVIYNNYAELIAPDGTATVLGPLSGTDNVTVAKNNASPSDVVCVASNAVYLLTTSGPPGPYPDSNVGAPNSVCFGDGYFFFTYGDGQCIASAINGTSIDLLDQITVNSSSTTLLRGVYYAQTLFLFTEATIEAWTDNANPVGFPFSRSQVIARGLLSALAVAGYESEFTATLIFVGNDNIVYLLQGYSPVRISTSDIERRISNLSDKTTLRAYVYESEGHAIWMLTSSDFSLCYDITNSVWNERKSDQLSFCRIEHGVAAFGGWVVGDYATGLVGMISANTFSEYGNTLTYDLESLGTSKFPMFTPVHRADFNFIVGTGLPEPSDPATPQTDYASDPQAMISWSDDGGAHFSMPVQRSIGKIGVGNQGITILRTGQTSRYGRVWRVQVSDPVYVGLFSGTMESA